MKKKLYYISILISIVFIFTVSYTTWNLLNPKYTCALCHEIQPAHHEWTQSFHKEIACIDCHGTALESWDSAMEKLNMVVTHFTKKKTSEDISLSEKQSLGIANKCATCHQAEHAAWHSGSHSVNYNDIFMDPEHNKMERPYWDCFRCHGMFYDGDIDELMDLHSTNSEEWFIKDNKVLETPTITCLSCHQSHQTQIKYEDYQTLSDSIKKNLAEKERFPPTAIYMRANKRHLPSVDLLEIKMYDGDSLMQIITDPNTLLCMQCHSPDISHQLGSSDDKTPVGIYEEMSCITCHDPHSNQLKTNHRNVHKRKSF